MAIDTCSAPAFSMLYVVLLTAMAVILSPHDNFNGRQNVSCEASSGSKLKAGSAIASILVPVDERTLTRGQASF